ncbi:DUF6600 domain-containing protein [Ramlibacter sp. PS4R-6]|uniref:DUF6600 domain-containing protein n=1 Tax=Ramlibacter sp. PS4R-6 TaxID=3133438 RepID=UPI0030994D38
MRARPFFLSIRISAAMLLGVLASTVFAQGGDPPGRIGRINYSEGAVSFAPSGDDEFTDADLNRPLSPGDKLWTDKGVRAELQAGSAAVRMDGRTHVTVLALDDQSTQLSVTQGTVYLRVRSLPEGENFEVDTPNLAWRASYPGDYRIDVDAQRGTTRVTIHSGTGAVYGEKGQALPMGGGQQIIFKGRTLAQVDSHEQPPQDNFDRWAAERNRREDQSVAARYVPREVVGYQLLDTTGQWQQDATHGVVWYPQSVKAEWAPYRNGRWEWLAPWGWTWIDEAPWAFVTSHYGRWTLVGKKWGWVPGRMGLRPIYAPALVAFVGHGAAPLAVGGKQTVAWFPLAPGEAWQPTYKATPLYISSVNANMPPLADGSYAYQRKPEALTAVAMEDFQRGKPSKGSWLRVAANALTNAQVVAPPAMPERAKTMVARASNPEIKPAVNKGPTAAQQLEMQRQADAAKQLEAQKTAEAQKLAEVQKKQAAEAQKQAEAQARAERERLARDDQQRKEREQVAKAEEAKRSGQAKAAREQERAVAERERAAAEQQARLAQQQQQQRALEQSRVAQDKRAAEQARRAEVAKQREVREQREQLAKAEQARQSRAAQQQQQRAAAEQARREQVAKREQAKRDQVAKARVERELQARRAQEAKRMAVAAKKDDEARRIAHAQEVERSRRAAEREAQVLQAQRTQREEALRRVSEEKEKERAQREAWARQQQLLAEQWKRDQQAFEEQQRARAQTRQRPDLRRSQPAAEPEVWQRGVPILNPGRTS